MKCDRQYNKYKGRIAKSRRGGVDLFVMGVRKCTCGCGNLTIKACALDNTEKVFDLFFQGFVENYTVLMEPTNEIE